MSLDDGQVNCILQVCCPGESARATLANYMAEEFGMKAHEAKKCADWILDTFDLAPHGTLGAFKAEIARLARG